MPRAASPEQRALQEGYRSGLEDRVASSLRRRGVGFGYEEFALRYEKPARIHRYTPDFWLRNGIVVETKGRWVSADRQKITLVRQQYPDLDIRFVFSNPQTRISKVSKTTYAMVCDKLGIPYAKGDIPDAWTAEPVNEVSLKIIRDFLA
jgi:hypothetical protein